MIFTYYLKSQKKLGNKKPHRKSRPDFIKISESIKDDLSNDSNTYKSHGEKQEDVKLVDDIIKVIRATSIKFIFNDLQSYRLLHNNELR